jgi:hypothetical protein
MGLGSKLGQRNRETATLTGQANGSVTEQGYNPQNLNIAPMPPMQYGEVKEVQEIRDEAIGKIQQESMKDGNIQNLTQFHHLKMPVVPYDADPDRLKINELVVAKMWRIICIRKLHPFYNQQYLQELVNRACKHDYRLLMNKWNIASIDMTVDLAVLGLYDIVLFCDDSGSMKTKEPIEDNLTRWELLREVTKTISFWATLMDADGIVVRFFNSDHEGDGIGSPDEVDKMFNTVRPNHSTPLGSELKNKILDKFLFRMIDQKQLQRPILIITITLQY